MSYQFAEQKECDLVVIGGGGAGMVAAGRASFLGKKVIVLEKTGVTGGAGVFASAIRTFGSKWQKERGLPDVLNEFALDAMDKTYWKLDPKLVANTFRATGEFFDWFYEVGDNVEDQLEVGFYIFDGPDGPQVPLLKNSGPHSGLGKLVMQTMLDMCIKTGAEVLTRHKVVDIEVAGGKITAVIAQTENGYVRIGCKACVLASGSWIRVDEIMKKVAPVFVENGHPLSPHHNPNYTGDGLPIAEKAGAFIDYDSFCIRPMGPMCMSKSEVFNTMGNSPFSIYINLNGKRWICEPSQVRMGIFNSGHVLMDQPKGVSFAVFDENTLAAAIEESRQPHEGYGGFFGFPKFPASMPEVYADLDKAVSDPKSGAFKADTIEELAGKMGVVPAALKDTIAGYNAYCRDGMDWDYYKSAENLVPLNKGPYYAIKGELGSDGVFGGVLVNPEMQAYKKGGGLVEGLYAAGDFASGRHINMNGVKIQVINDCSWAFASGFMSGTNAAKYLESV